MKLTQKNFNDLINGMNHRLTKIEIDMKWVKYIGYYLSGIFTLALIGEFL